VKNGKTYRTGSARSCSDAGNTGTGDQGDSDDNAGHFESYGNIDDSATTGIESMKTLKKKK